MLIYMSLAPKKCKLWDEAEFLYFPRLTELNQLLPLYHDSG